jgi:hypothetical protein
VDTPADAPRIDTTVSHVARIWNYWLGGKDNYDVDRQVGDQITQMLPTVPVLARAARQFLNRAVTHLTAEAGIRQFLDIGTGLPTVDNTHEVAQRSAPDARIVYVDNDPLVLAHAQALLTGSPQGVIRRLDALGGSYEPPLLRARPFRSRREGAAPKTRRAARRRSRRPRSVRRPATTGTLPA